MANVMVSHQTQSIQRFELLGASEGALGAWTSETTGKGVLRGAVARLFLCSNGLLRTCQDRNRTNLIGIALYGVAAMAGPKTRVSWRTGCAIIARSTAPAMVSCEKPSPNPGTTPAKR